MDAIMQEKMNTINGIEYAYDKSNNHDDHEKDHHEMTMKDIKEKFKDDFPDEIHDSNKYLNMAIAAESEDKNTLAKGLYEVAYDEYTHAKFIHDNLVDWGCEISEKETMKWHELEERIHRKFRR